MAHHRIVVGAGRMQTIVGHGELHLDDGCIVRVTPSTTIHTYGIGMSLRALAKDPLNAAATVVEPAPA